MIIVLAGDHRQFRYWCQEQRRSSNDRSVVYAASEHHLRGLHNVPHVIVGTFWDRDDSEILWELAKYAEMP